MVCHTEDGAKSEVLCEQDVEEDIWDERDEVNRERRRLYNEESYDLYCSPNVIWVMKSRIMRRAGHIAHMGDRRGANGFWWKNLGYRDHWEDLGLYGRIILTLNLLTTTIVAPPSNASKW